MSHLDENVRKATEAEIVSVLERAHDLYDASTDLTMGIEEEFAICDPESLDLVPGFDAVADVARRLGWGDEISSELIASEIEFRTDRAENFAEASDKLLALRAGVADVAQEAGVALLSCGTHPWADYREQPVVASEYYERLVDMMRYAAHRNNTFGLHVHFGVNGADRAIAVCDALRQYLPMLLGLSASSPFLEGRDTGLDRKSVV